MKLLEYVFVQVDVETGELIRDEEEKEEKEEEEENNGPSTSTPPGVQRDPSAPWDTPWTEKEEKDLRIAEFRAIREARAEREKADELKNTMLNCKWWNDD
uniref:Calreticulin n=1 Tax=Caenorhabditis tropicalis TaxID=1561998 RepID=A0A1I7UNX7_9PELO